MGIKSIAENRRAYHEYFILEKYEAGMVLMGTEIKSIRKGAVQFKDAYVSFQGGEAILKEMYIAPYEEGNRFNHEETRERKLLLHRSEIQKLEKKVKLKGFTIVPLTLYLKDGRAKLEIGLAKGKELHDKRETDKERSAQREIEKARKQYR